jgi:hypothetical protein
VLLSGWLRRRTVPVFRIVLLAALGVAGLGSPAASVAAGPGGPIDDTARELSCRALYAGTVGIPDLLPGRSVPGSGAEKLWPAPAAGLLPARVYLRTATGTFNSRYAFATRGGAIWFEPAAGDGLGWRELPLPDCFAGRVSAVSVDDDELIALDGARRVFTMDNALKDPVLFNWTSRWGPPFWTGPGFQLPAGAIAWSWSVLSPAEDKTWTDTAGNAHAVGAAKVSHIWTLRGGGQRLTFNDPWLPTDQSYEACGPIRGRFRAVDMSASGSTLFVIGRYGDMFTRLFDFDISGSDQIFFQYSYYPQRRGDPNAAFQLPSPPWVHQPKIPGRITSLISISKIGTGAVHRTLRVEGLDRLGHSGYWEKDSADTSARGWRFHRTDQPRRGRRLSNPRADSSHRGLGRAADLRYTGTNGSYAVELPNFNVHCSPALLRVAPAGEPRITLRLHNIDGLRQSPIAAGLDAVPREQYGAIEVPPALLRRIGTEPAKTRDLLLRMLGGRRFTQVTLEVTATELRIAELGWTFRRR